mmetsp:Transcript_17528/g.51296  ORF Transcript_17528/g.51296 Transcript_17528/m.51296 type:complete len:226 (-) Transcript_17528:505-1182(-)
MSLGISTVSISSKSTRCFLFNLGNRLKSSSESLARNSLISGKSPGDRDSVFITLRKTEPISFKSSCCLRALPVSMGICLLRWLMMWALTLANRARLTSSLILRTAEFRGRSRRSFIKSFSSRSKRLAISSYMSGCSQKLPMYTRSTSGVFRTFPMPHMRAPYTRMRRCRSIWSALFSTQRILSSCPLSRSMTARNSSEMSSLWASKRSRIKSQRSANQWQTSMNW